MPTRSTKPARAAIWTAMSVEEMSTLSTRELLAIQQYARGTLHCYCSLGSDCESPQLTKAEVEHNRMRDCLANTAKAALAMPYKGAVREHIPSVQEGKQLRRAAAKRTDKKQMAYRK